jgi:hypothetical protein
VSFRRCVLEITKELHYSFFFVQPFFSNGGFTTVIETVACPLSDHIS